MLRFTRNLLVYLRTRVARPVPDRTSQVPHRMVAGRTTASEAYNRVQEAIEILGALQFDPNISERASGASRRAMERLCAIRAHVRYVADLCEPPVTYTDDAGFAPEPRDGRANLEVLEGGLGGL